ncbi:hypothetical protein T440DRAFT_232074 [Plenodomus tracheiphilus IPT5]|uniref:DNA/RNA-binding protein Alba-like domain-containing protein n=1 Tax=Plenodomus tracheiphilus IPT5 TaxID=1408161 RepID=A0A6A7ATD2_9PLEO|nr:hypothetical protein T440DRAFT_232074 [Plenodomus tracheiphilus IPT5]
MAKPKRMSEIFTSSSDKLTNTAPAPAPATATPPYSSEGPTLPLIGAPEDQIPTAENNTNTNNPSKKRKIDSQPTNSTLPTQRGPPPKPPHTLHPALYTPWTLLPPEILTLLETQARIRTTTSVNIVPVVFSKNQNVKAGINKLKTLLGAYKEPKEGIGRPVVLKEEDALIAVSAQGEGAGKLVGIVELVKRIIAPEKREEGGKGVEKWCMYTVLSSVEVEMEPKGRQDTDKNNSKKDGIVAEEAEEEEEEEEAFDRMEVDKEQEKAMKKVRKVPVLTVWLTKKRVPVFAKEFGEQSILVKIIEEE